MEELEPQPPSTLHRRHSISTSVVIPNKLSLHISRLPNGSTTTPAPLDFEIVSLSYTSLKDLLPSNSVAINSPSATAAVSSLYEISIRNRLVKHAAWAYLQPMPSSPNSSASHFLCCPWLQFSTLCNLAADFFNFINSQVIPGICRPFDGVFLPISVRHDR